MLGVLEKSLLGPILAHIISALLSGADIALEDLRKKVEAEVDGLVAKFGVTPEVVNAAIDGLFVWLEAEAKNLAAVVSKAV